MCTGEAEDHAPKGGVAELAGQSGAGSDVASAKAAMGALAQGLGLGQDGWRQLRQHLLVRRHQHLVPYLRWEARERRRQIKFLRAPLPRRRRRLLNTRMADFISAQDRTEQLQLKAQGGLQSSIAIFRVVSL